MLVSCILLTTHPKRAAYLPDAVRSFRAQTHPDKELVVVNDGAPLASRSPDIRVVNLPARGRRYTIGEKRNVGIREARGEWLATWDDDDVSLPARLTEQLDAAMEHDANLVLTDQAAVADEQMKVVGNCQLLTNLVMASLLVTRDLAVRTGGYTVVDFAEDQAFYYRAALLGRARVLRMPRATWYVVRRHDANTTNDFGDSRDAWVRCALRDPKAQQTQMEVDDVLTKHSGSL